MANASAFINLTLDRVAAFDDLSNAVELVHGVSFELVSY